MGSFVVRLLPLFIAISFFIINKQKQNIVSISILILSGLLVVLSGERVSFFYYLTLIFFYFFFLKNKKIFIFYFLFFFFFFVLGNSCASTPETRSIIRRCIAVDYRQRVTVFQRMKCGVTGIFFLLLGPQQWSACPSSNLTDPICFFFFFFIVCAPQRFRRNNNNICRSPLSEK